jgi:hypothetical protein
MEPTILPNDLMVGILPVHRAAARSEQADDPMPLLRLRHA